MLTRVDEAVKSSKTIFPPPTPYSLLEFLSLSVFTPFFSLIVDCGGFPGKAFIVFASKISGGTPMALKVFNTLGRKKMLFKPLEKGKVRMYACGPTVYDLPHVGNYRSFFMSDLIRRFLEYSGFEVKLVMNITDIDDKTIRRSAEEGVSLKEFTRKYEKVFKDGLDALNIKPATIYPRATETIPQMIQLVKKLEENGIAYDRKDAVYYNISKFKDYGKLSGVDLKKMKTGATVSVDEYDKNNPRDFALWKKSTPEELERPEICFDSPWGKGRPGWHLECSTMSMQHLGETIDVHTGGVDLIFPHHENEIAQSEGATGKPFVKYWLHGEHLLVDGTKMSKSKGNYFTLTDLLEKYSSHEIRYLFLSTHYRDKLDYTKEKMENAVQGAEKISNALETLDFLIENAVKQDSPENKKLEAKLEERGKEFVQAMNDDFDSPLALKTIHSMFTDVFKYTETTKDKKTLERARKVLKQLLSVLGLFEKEREEELEPELMRLIKEREKAREQKNWERADEIRQELRQKGVLLDDFPEGTKWRRVKK
jgi:cysteinyl-tRNA synthetase